MPPPSTIKDIQPPDQITPIAAKGFLAGAARFGAISILAHFALNRIHPVYRGLTLQFKVFIQLSAMMLGGCIFAEKRVSEYNDAVRMRRRALQRSAHAWNEEQEIRARVGAESEAERAARRR
ncbi:hypothetical protein DV736_g3651, partial [Chaetothyriales sp. CBS 134916]